PDPDNAWSDAKQQITPFVFKELIDSLVLREATSSNEEYLENIEDLRHQIDLIDNELLDLLGKRMELADNIGLYKKRNNIAILQPARWIEILEAAAAKGKKKGLGEEFIGKILKAIHQESINHQEEVMNRPEVNIEVKGERGEG
ncbi:MAG: chorismate mutase, partial [Saprospiraceae bacterium]